MNYETRFSDKTINLHFIVRFEKYSWPGCLSSLISSRPSMNHLKQPNSWLRGIGYIALIITTLYFLNACRTIDGGSIFHFPQPSSCARDSDTTPLPTRSNTMLQTPDPRSVYIMSSPSVIEHRTVVIDGGLTRTYSKSLSSGLHKLKS